MAGNVYPGAFPTVNGDKITVEQWMKNPTMLRRTLESLVSQRFIGDYLFGSGDAQGGAVIYDQLTAQDLYPSEGDVGEIAPGDEFPSADTSDPTPKTARVTKRGLQTKITYEHVRRNDRDVMRRKLIKLSNAMALKMDVVMFGVLDAEPLIPKLTAAKPLTDATADPINDVLQGIKVVDEADLGYKIDSALINPQEYYRLLGRKDVRDALPREARDVNPILSRDLAGFLNIDNWYVSNRQTAGKMRLLQKGITGSMRDEVSFYSRTIDKQELETYLVQVGRVSVPIITDPFSMVEIGGLAA